MGTKKNLPSQIGGRSVQLHDNGLRAGSLIEQSLANLTKEQTQNLMAEAAKVGLGLEAKAREQDLDYVSGSREIANHIDTIHRLPGGDLSHSVSSSIKTGAGHMHIESRSRGLCFVASAAYSDSEHPDVVLLRQFRDEVLTRSSAGRSFIKWYWRIGPYLARVISPSPHLRSGTRWLISHLVSLLR
jgi:hypothetical protein